MRKRNRISQGSSIHQRLSDEQLLHKLRSSFNSTNPDTRVSWIVSWIWKAFASINIQVRRWEMLGQVAKRLKFCLKLSVQKLYAKRENFRHVTGTESTRRGREESESQSEFVLILSWKLRSFQALDWVHLGDKEEEETFGKAAAAFIVHIWNVILEDFPRIIITIIFLYAPNILTIILHRREKTELPLMFPQKATVNGIFIEHQDSQIKQSLPALFIRLLKCLHALLWVVCGLVKLNKLKLPAECKTCSFKLHKQIVIAEISGEEHSQQSSTALDESNTTVSVDPKT